MSTSRLYRRDVPLGKRLGEMKRWPVARAVNPVADEPFVDVASAPSAVPDLLTLEPPRSDPDRPPDVIFIRHAEACHNAAFRDGNNDFRAYLRPDLRDAVLTPAGAELALLRGRQFRVKYPRWKAAVVYSSPLRRALQTAGYFSDGAGDDGGESGAEVIVVDDALAERQGQHLVNWRLPLAALSSLRFGARHTHHVARSSPDMPERAPFDAESRESLRALRERGRAWVVGKRRQCVGDGVDTRTSRREAGAQERICKARHLLVFTHWMWLAAVVGVDAAPCDVIPTWWA